MMLHTIALTLLRGLTQAQTLELLRNNVDVSGIFETPEQTLAALHPDMQRTVMALVAEQRVEVLARAEKELDFCERHNIQPLSLHGDQYPRRLSECADAPPVLYYRGNADLNARQVLAVVGTRRITAYGKDLCRRLCCDLAELLPQTLVVSGLAYGVDVHVHRACVEQQLNTVGVLAHGLDQLYPSVHRDCAKAMLQQGGLLTEYLSGVRPLAGNFVRRNRIVAGMADATIVVESAAKGGALITARLAADYNRLVCAFPGRAGDPYSEGCNALIRKRSAELVTSAQDIVNFLGWNEQVQQMDAVQLNLFPTFTPDQQRVADALRPSDGLSVSQLATQTGLSLSQINTVLFELEMGGHLLLLPGGRYRLMN